MKPQYQFYKTTNKAKEFYGDRYFRVSWESDHVVQVCLSNGNQFRRGKANTIGAYIISRQTFLSNYFAMNNVQPTTKSAFKKKFDEVVKWLS